MSDDDTLMDDTGALDSLTEEQRTHVADNEARWRRQRLKDDIDEAKRRLEIAMQLLADATVFLEEEDE